jgi:hypothetical protein
MDDEATGSLGGQSWPIAAIDSVGGVRQRQCGDIHYDNNPPLVQGRRHLFVGGF